MACAYGNDRWVVLLANGDVQISTDGGVTWGSPVATPISQSVTSAWPSDFGIAYHPGVGRWVVIGSGAIVGRSTDGTATAWDAESAPVSTDYVLQSVVFDEVTGTLVAVAYKEPSEATVEVVESSDGATWDSPVPLTFSEASPFLYRLEHFDCRTFLHKRNSPQFFYRGCWCGDPGVRRAILTHYKEPAWRRGLAHRDDLPPGA
jgi:hypothetical protein